MDIWALKLKMECDYATKLAKYKHETEMLAMQRKKFYEENPDFPIKTMFIQVCAPPQKISINII